MYASCNIFQDLDVFGCRRQGGAKEKAPVDIGLEIDESKLNSYSRLVSMEVQ